MLKSTLNVTVSIKPIDYSDFRKLVEQVDPEFKTFSRSRYTNVRCFGAVTSRGQLASAVCVSIEPKDTFFAPMHLTKTSIAVGFIDIVTSPEYRHFGFAYSLVSRAKQLRGLDLFYCVTKTNAASIALARRLKFTPLDMSSVQNPDVDNQLWFRA